MSEKAYMPTPLEALEWVETQTYPNPKAYKDTKRQVEANVSKVVRAHDKFFIEQGQAAQAWLDQAHKTSEGLQDQLAELGGAAKRGEPVDMRAYQRLEVEAQDIMRTAATVDTRFETMLTQMADPLKSLDDLLKKFSNLNRPGLID